MSDRILYGARESGHAYKVRQTLVLLGLKHAYRHVDLSVRPEDRRADFVAVSPFQEVPVLVTDGTALAQSNAILWALSQETGRLDGGDPRRCLQWLFWEANRIGISLPNLRFERFTAATPDVEKVSVFGRRLQADLTLLEDRLAERAFIMGDTLSVADIACAAYLPFAEQAGLDLGLWPTVSAWVSRLWGLEGWRHPYDLIGPEFETEV